MTLTPEREQEIREATQRDAEGGKQGRSSIGSEDVKAMLAEIDRLRADLATAREALEKIARDRVTRSGRDARVALDRIGEQ